MMDSKELADLRAEIQHLRAVVDQLCTLAYCTSKVSVETISALFHIRAGGHIPNEDVDSLIAAVKEQMAESKKANDMISKKVYYG